MYTDNYMIGEMSGDGDGDGGDKSKPPDDPLGRTGRAFGGE